MFRNTAVTLMCLLPALAFAQQPPTKLIDGFIVDPTGMALYTFDLDGSAKSQCNGECARAWPPLSAEANAKPWADYAPFARADGSWQWAYKGKPLYRYSRDQAAGDRNGDGAGNQWRLARP